MKPIPLVRALFFLAGLYDVVLGVAFLAAGTAIFHHCHVSPPNHMGYVRFPALLIIIFGLMFFAVAFNPLANRNLIPYGILLKFSYSGIVFYYWSTSTIPAMWKPFAVIDLIMALLFVWAYAATRTPVTR
jgi:hypothetical protein